MELIDLQLLITHIFAFLLVLWLLRRFAWGPVLRFLNERRARIAGEFGAIDEQRGEVAVLRRDYETRLEGIAEEARRKIQEAVAEGNAMAARLKERAQEDRRLKLERAAEEIRLLEDSAKETLRKRTVALALQAAEKAIGERMDEEKHRRLIEGFIAELEAAGTAEGCSGGTA
ncbi:MAG: F0F1 ATP synthase subunit B [Candidatus Eisenbacteria sp.]|nr:F0F1 ATP synthase subunit B [Candidatus Eisenbacteria bacterium]